MIKVGQHKRAKYWGGYTVEKVAVLSKPVLVHSQEVDRALFNPTLVKLKWDQDNFRHEFWFPYWITLNDAKEKYGQFAPMMGEATLLELLREAIRQDFFSERFLSKLHEATAPRPQDSGPL